jgi:glucuronosyltransferase
LERAVFWSEYLMRHGGASHLRSPAKELNLAQFYNLDVLAFLAVSAMATMWVLWKLSWWAIMRGLARVFA